MAATKEQIGAALKAVREKRGFTHAEMASRLGVNRSAYTHYETGTNEIKASRLAIAAQVLEVPAGVLLGEVSISAADDDEFIRWYRALPAADRDRIRNVALAVVK